MAVSKKRKDKGAIEKEIAEGKQQQQDILSALDTIKPQFSNGELIKNRDDFETLLTEAFQAIPIKLDAVLKKALFAPGALAERDPSADMCTDKKGNTEPDSELRDTENVPLPLDIPLPLPLGYENKKINKGKVDKTALLALVEQHCEEYLAEEVLPYRPDAWIDFDKTKLGYEIPFNRHFYQYEAPRDLEEIEAEIKGLEAEVLNLLKEVV